jgi:hypothetical protein
MKKLFTLSLLALSLMAMADIESGAPETTPPNAERVQAARSCFAELERLGCGHPGDDLEQFRSCMNNVHGSLSSRCQAITTRLYGKRK